MRNTSEFPINPINQSNLIIATTNNLSQQSYKDNSALNGITYYYAIFTQNNLGAYSVPKFISSPIVVSTPLTLVGTTPQVTVKPALDQYIYLNNKEFTINIYEEGNQQPIYRSTQTPSGGSIVFPNIPLLSGIYDIRVSSPNYLSIRSRVNLAPNATITLPPLKAGDFNGDEKIDQLDSPIILNNWFTNNSQADLNTDGIVNALDWGVFNKNWNLQGSW
jgi:hypothetical protein